MSNLPDIFKNRFAIAIAKWGKHEDFAKKAGISRATVTRWLAGENTPDLNQVESAARVLDKAPIDLIMSDEDAKELSLAWREVIRRVGKLDETEVDAIVTGIRAVRAGRKLDEAERLTNLQGKLPKSSKD